MPVRCVIIGEGPSRPRLEAQIRRLKLEQNVWLLGERKEVTAWLSSFDIFVLPSLWEGLPNSLLEAMALGLPAIASRVDGIPEVIENDKTGILVPPKEPAQLAIAIASLAGDSEKRTALGAAAKAEIGEKFSFVKMLAAYEKAYDDVLTR